MSPNEFLPRGDVGSIQRQFRAETGGLQSNTELIKGSWQTDHFITHLTRTFHQTFDLMSDQLVISALYPR